MTIISKSALVEYTAEQMYKLVDNVLEYPDFLPWCRSSHEISRTETELKAGMEIAHSGLHKSFTTLNHNEPFGKIDIQLVEGPFKHLCGKWRFDPLNDTACKITLDMDFEFSNRLVSMTFGPIFSSIASSLVDAFVKRAKVVYD